MRGSEQLAWLDRLEKDSDNLRAALEWSLRHQEPEHETSLEARQQATQASLRFVGALYLFWKRRARWSEGRDWLKRALAPPADLALARARVKALNAAVLLASDQADTGAAYQLAEENLALSRQLGDSHSIARSLNSLGFLLWKKKDFAGARASCEEALRAFRELGDRFAAADALHNLSHIAINKNDYAAAQLYCGEAAEIYRELGDDIGFDDALGDLGLLAYLQNDFPRAQVLLEESLTHFRAAASVPGIVSALNRLGDVARCEGNYDLADKLYSESLTLYRDMGDKDEFPGLLHNQAYVAQHRGDYAHALSLFKEALEIQRETTNQAGIAECLAGIAGVWIAQGKAQHGARLLAMVEALRDAIGASVWPANRIEYDRNLALLHQSLNEATLAAAWAIGRAMTMDQAIAYALTETGEEI